MRGAHSLGLPPAVCKAKVSSEPFLPYTAMRSNVHFLASFGGEPNLRWQPQTLSQRLSLIENSCKFMFQINIFRLATYGDFHRCAP